MKKLALVLAMAFTMGLAASTVMAAPKDKKVKTECCAKTTDKKECCKKDATTCCKKNAATSCKKDAKAETKEVK
jgi:hypothetical protein